MIAQVITLTTSNAWVLGLVLIAVGAFLQYFVGLELDDRWDAKQEEAEADRDAILDATAEDVEPFEFASSRNCRCTIQPIIPAQRDGGAS